MSIFQMAAVTYKIVIVGGSIYEKIGEKVYSTCYVFDKNGTASRPIKKKKLVPIEKEFCEPSDTETEPVRTSDFCIGACICYDLNSPELVKTLVDKGAQIICAGTLGIRPFLGRPFNHPYSLQCDAPQIVRAQENEIAIARAYQCGFMFPDSLVENFLYLDGLSNIVNQQGAEVERSYPGFRDQEHVLVAEAPLR